MWRPITTADVPAWCELLAAAEAVDATSEHYDVDDLLEELSDPALDAERDAVAAFDQDGRMAAYGLVRGAVVVHGVHRVHAEGCVHPAHRRSGLGREVLGRTARRAAQLRRPDLPGELLVYTYDGNAGAAALLSSAGLRPVRYWYDMHRDLDGPLPEVLVPEGLRLVGYEPELDEALRLARNDAFADHWGSVQRDQPSWRHWFTGCRAFRPALSFAMLAGDEVAGLLLCNSYDADDAASGVRQAWAATIGTRSPWRRRGVATALLARALAAYTAAGYQRAALSVDTGNPTGALGVYQRCGFSVNTRWTTYARPL